MSNVCIIIPARLNSSRLPRKMLLPIQGKPLLYYTWKKAVESELGDVFIASVDDEIIDVMKTFGAISYKVENTNSGTDAVWQCYKKYLSEKYEYIINLQGDMPTIPKNYIKKVLEPVYYFDIGTLCYEIDFLEASKPQVVKVVFNNFRADLARALYFSRSPIPYGSNIYHYHVGLYSFRRESLRRFCDYKQSRLELIEKLEQLRALENDMTIGVKIIEKNHDEKIYGIDTIEEYERFKEEMNQK